MQQTKRVSKIKQYSKEEEALVLAFDREGHSGKEWIAFAKKLKRPLFGLKEKALRLKRKNEVPVKPGKKPRKKPAMKEEEVPTLEKFSIPSDTPITIGNVLFTFPGNSVTFNDNVLQW